MSEKQFWNLTLRKLFSLLAVRNKINGFGDKTEYISDEEAFDDFEFQE